MIELPGGAPKHPLLCRTSFGGSNHHKSSWANWCLPNLRPKIGGESDGKLLTVVVKNGNGNHLRGVVVLQLGAFLFSEGAMLQIGGNNLFFCKQILQVPFYTDLITQIPLPRFLDDSTLSKKSIQLQQKWAIFRQDMVDTVDGSEILRSPVWYGKYPINIPLFTRFLNVFYIPPGGWPLGFLKPHQSHPGVETDDSKGRPPKFRKAPVPPYHRWMSLDELREWVDDLWDIYTDMIYTSRDLDRSWEVFLFEGCSTWVAIKTPYKYDM